MFSCSYQTYEIIANLQQCKLNYRLILPIKLTKLQPIYNAEQGRYRMLKPIKLTKLQPIYNNHIDKYQDQVPIKLTKLQPIYNFSKPSQKKSNLSNLRNYSQSTTIIILYCFYCFLSNLRNYSQSTTESIYPPSGFNLSNLRNYSQSTTSHLLCSFPEGRIMKWKAMHCVIT